MSAPALVVMAAGIGSRYGGLKQVDPVGPSGEILIEYSLYDAVRAGFGRVVFVITRPIEPVFRERVGERAKRAVEVRYAFQELDDLPAGFAVPAGRAKPWGTGHAALAARHDVDGPFAVINGDDFYGRNSFAAIAGFLHDARDDSKARYAMVGYPVENTLTEHGHVARGICQVDGNGLLQGITERTRIESRGGEAFSTEDGAAWHAIPRGTPVSMNLWGFTPGFLRELEARFPEFLKTMPDPSRSEYFLPGVVDAMVRAGAATVAVLPTDDRWFGVTYQQDKTAVAAAIARLVAAGAYPARLWG
ncbi:MAG: sugar phosphate nucleotidyltransferase [Candidatus Edwardsbacteria bacterium]|nr:sugar phosphate nucleotidyltransferase [Candidatus Edwardsbacteria bacterium]